MEKESSLENFFSPESIAVVGASDNPKKVGHILMKKLLNFKGKVIPINPQHREVLGKKSYASLTEYSGDLDLVIIAIPSQKVEKIIEECGKKQIKNVIVISAGFSEIKNFELEARIVEVAKRYKINLLGPNCFGIANPYLNLDTTFANTTARKGDIAFISQSGALWSSISDLSVGKFGFSGFVSLGNMACLNFYNFIKHFDEDKKTKTIVLYIEKLKQGKKFIEICKKSKKEIIAIKAGRTKQGSEATVSHTGSLATDFEIYKGAFKQANIRHADSLFSAFNYARLKIRPKGNRIVILTNAGGAGVLMADYCIEQELNLVKAPIDLLGTATAKDYETALNKLKNQNFYDSVIVILTPQKMSESEKTAKEIVEFSKTKSVIACFLGGDSVKKAKELLEKNNVPCFNNLKDVTEVLGVGV